MNRSANCCAVVSSRQGARRTILDKRSTNTAMAVKPAAVCGRGVIKSMLTESQVSPGTGRGCKRPTGTLLEGVILLWQESHVATKRRASRCMPSIATSRLTCWFCSWHIAAVAAGPSRRLHRACRLHLRNLHCQSTSLVRLTVQPLMVVDLKKKKKKGATRFSGSYAAKEPQASEGVQQGRQGAVYRPHPKKLRGTNGLQLKANAQQEQRP